MRFIGPLLLLLVLNGSLVFAEESWFAPTRGGDKPRNVYWRPLVSFVLPGLDQYLEGHVTSGLLYSSTWAASYAWASDRSHRLQEDQDAMDWHDWKKAQKDDYSTHEELARQATLSNQYLTAIGSMSAWHSFRTAVETQRSLGRYDFLRVEETPMDLLAAPFHFSYLERSTTWIPLLIAAGLGAVGSRSFDEDYQADPYTSSDAFYASALSYNAGVSEEALFRGYVHPLLREAWGSPFWANAAQSAVFGLAHLGTIERPFAQVGMGFYLGWLEQKRDWTLGEGVFIHTWWDVVALSSSYLVRLKDQKRGPPPVLWLPTFSLLL